jgi:hypothetical protein
MTDRPPTTDATWARTLGSAADETITFDTPIMRCEGGAL